MLGFIEEGQKRKVGEHRQWRHRHSPGKPFEQVTMTAGGSVSGPLDASKLFIVDQFQRMRRHAIGEAMVISKATLPPNCEMRRTVATTLPRRLA
jgi:hypothetical protein